MQTTDKLFKTYEREIKNSFRLVSTAKEGLKVNVFDDFIQSSNLPPADLANKLGLSEKTIGNYRNANKLFDGATSEQLLQLIALYKKGSEVFSTIEAFNKWLKKPAYGLGGDIPFELMNTVGGIQLVMDELYRIEFGALA